MDINNDELINLLKALQKFEVKYILVDDFATTLHGVTRISADIDIWIKDDSFNRKNLRKAIKELGLGDFEELETTDLIPGWTSIYLDSGFELDIMTYIAGFDKNSFDTCYQMAVEAIIAEISVKFLHINHLLDSKRLTNRVKDVLDINELEKIKKLQQGD
jgi:hypothetical protein